MSRTRVLVAAAGALLLLALLLRQAPPGASARPPDPSPPPRAAAPSARPTPLAVPARDIFRYVGDEEPEPAPAEDYGAAEDMAEPEPPPSLAETPAPAPSGPRLVGLVRQAGTLRAALALDGEVVVVKEGDRAGAYTVVAIDEEAGVVLRDAAGVELSLSPPPP